jgi:hypothetical protein
MVDLEQPEGCNPEVVPAQGRTDGGADENTRAA